MTIAIGAPHSGSGKTTVTLAILAALQRRGLRIQPFKVGPDYIDPQWHRMASGQTSRNLDPVLTSEAYVQRCYAHHVATAEGGLIEGVMGLFDGRAGTIDQGSTAHVARLLDIPVVLVIDAAKLGQSVAAIVYGYRHYDPRLKLAGVILNNVGSPRHEQILRAALTDTPILGILPRTTALPSRHLGLVTPDTREAAAYCQHLATLAETHLDWDALLPLIRSQPCQAVPLWPLVEQPEFEPISVQIGVAIDAAFSFYYADNLDLLKALGATLVPFSPLAVGLDLPVEGLYLGGGYPELYAAQLSERLKPQQPLPPTYAECGGLMILARRLTDPEGQVWPMQAALPCDIKWQQRLTLGYRQASVLRDSPLLKAGDTVMGHEFHRSRSLPPPTHPLYGWDTVSAERYTEGWCQGTLQASYLHLHWGDRAHSAQDWLRFVQQMRPTPR